MGASFYKMNLRAAMWILLACAVVSLAGSSRRDKENLYLLGLFPTYPEQSMADIGYDCLVSAKLALQHVNENPDILRDFNLKMIEIDTLNDAGWTMNELLQELLTNASGWTSNPVMIIGPLRNEITEIVSLTTYYWNLIQISYGSHAPKLGDRRRYRLLYRTIMSTTGYNDPRLLMIKQWGWKRVATLGTIGSTMAMEDMYTKLINNSIEILAKENYDDDLIQPFKFFKEKDVRIIVGNFYEFRAKKVFCEAYRAGLYGPKYVWMIFGHYDPNWWLDGDLYGCTADEMSAAVEGAVSVGFQTLSTQDVETVGKITPSEYRNIMLNLTRRDYSVEIRPPPYAYDAVWAAALALNASIQRIAPKTLDDFVFNDTDMSEAFCRSLNQVNFMGVSGLVSFDSNGDRRGEFRIRRIINGTDLDIGHYNRGTDTIIWYYTVEEIFASSGGKPPEDSDITVTEYHKDAVSYELFVSMTAFSSVGIATAIGFLAFNIFYRNERLIKMSSPNLNDLIIVGCIMTYGTAILLGVDARLLSDRQLQVMCQVRAWLFGISFTLSFGAMFSKTWRVYSIFTNKKLQKRVIKDYRLFAMVGILLMIDIAIFALWQILDDISVTVKTLSIKEDPERPNTKVVLQQHNCSGELTTYFIWAVYIYKGLLLVFGTFIVWQTRNVNIPALNDSKYIGLSIYNVVIFSALGVPLSYLLAENSGYTYAIVGGLIVFCTTLTLCLLFLPKVLRIIYGYAPEEVGTRVMSNINNGRQGTRNGPCEERTRSVVIGCDYSTVGQDERERATSEAII